MTAPHHRRNVRVTHDSVRARNIVQQYLQWPIMTVEPPDLLRAMEQAERYRLSCWDALIVTGAQKAPASVLWTEDLNGRPRMGDLVLRNPFMPMGCSARNRHPGACLCQVLYGWDPRCGAYRRVLNWDADAQSALGPSREVLDTAYQTTAAYWDTNPAIRL